MGTQKLSRRWTVRGWLAAAVAVGVLTPSCAPDYVTSNNAPVNLYIAAIAPNVLPSDVRNGSKQFAEGTGPLCTCPDFATVSAAVRNKNPLAPTPNVPSAVIIDGYAVRYFRTDGRGVEGVDVPYRITGSLTMAVDVANAGTSAVDD